MKALLDTNILIDYLKGHEQARQELALYPTTLVSVVTWIEILVGARDGKDELSLKAFLKQFPIVGVDSVIGEKAATIRRELRIPLPDAVVLATARAEEALLVTRNTRDFPPGDPGIRFPYTLE